MLIPNNYVTKVIQNVLSKLIADYQGHLSVWHFKFFLSVLIKVDFISKTLVFCILVNESHSVNIIHLSLQKSRIVQRLMVGVA